MRDPKRIAIDFDNTIATTTNFPHIGPPKVGAKESLAAFRRLGYKVIIWSCRACHWDYDIYGGDPRQPVMEREHVLAMIKWLDAHGIEYDYIDDGSKGKPNATYFIDDKAIHFDDNWKAIEKQIMREDIRRTLQEETPVPKKEGKLLAFARK